MNRILLFLFGLFATLWIVNALPNQIYKKATQFIPCPGMNKTLSIKISPDPPVSNKPVTFEISGNLNHTLSEKSFLFEVSGHLFNEANICSIPGIKCPIEAGTDFNLKQEFPGLPASDYFAISIIDSSLIFCEQAVFEKPEPILT